MNGAAMLDIFGALAAFAALPSIFWMKTHRVGGVAKCFLTASLMVYAFVVVCNALEHLGVTAALDPIEDYAEILFFPFVLFFAYATWVKQEITHRIRAQERVQQVNAILRAVQQINQLIVRKSDRELLIEAACQVLAGMRGFCGAWVIALDSERRLLAAAQSGLPEEFAKIVEQARAGSLPPCTRKALAQHGVMEIKQGEAVCHGCFLEETHRRSPFLLTRLDHADQVHGVLMVLGVTAVPFREEERALFQELADDLGLALHKFGLQEERQGMEAQFRQAQKMEAVGRLAGGIAHDFRNQLTVIGGYCDLLLEEVTADSPLWVQLSEVRKAARRAENLTNQLLAFSRKQVLQPQAISLNDVVREIEKPLTSMLGENTVLSLGLAEDLSTADVDVGQLQQAVVNLVANARDAMHEGGTLSLETANVELDVSYTRHHPEVSPGPYVMLAISDTGVGMDKDTLDKAFDPFFTTKEKGKGTGLGLSMVYGFVKQSGGSIFVYSEPGHGTTFKLYFPRSGAAPETLLPQPAVAEARPSGTEKILLVEDNEAVRGLARQVLRECGYSVLEAANAEQALSLVQAHPEKIDLLLTDVVMPGASGSELAEKLVADRPEMKTLFISGYTGVAIDRHGLARPGANLLPKPFGPAALAQAVRSTLNADGPTTDQAPAPEQGGAP
jgi:signal transduction histidine kinase/ActR/RegA family two-component response regulator